MSNSDAHKNTLLLPILNYLIIILSPQLFSQTLENNTNSDSAKTNPLLPKLVFTELQIFNKPAKIGTDEPLQKPISEADKIVLSYDQYVFNISFAVLNHKHSEDDKYAYQLIGFDEGWQNVGNQRTIRYTNLDPGRYIFKVKTINNVALWNDKGISIQVLINPPFWATLIFRLIISIIIILSIYGIYRFRTNSITKRNKELLELNRELNDQIYYRMKLQQQLDQAQKLDSIGTLAGGIAHDFNNLLTVIKGYSDIALVKIKDKNDPIYKNISEVRDASERAENLTNQILTFSRKQIYKPKIIDINKIISDSSKMMHRLIGEDININMKLAREIPAINADPVQIEQVIINLIINARDAINQKTKKASEKKIIIETSQKYLDEEYTKSHIDSQQGQHIIFSISDNGIGMTQEVQDKIFEPFYTTKDKGKGTGLGLATVYGIVKQNSGNIYVYSEPNEGTTFKVFWPASKEPLSSTDKKPIIKVDLAGSESLLVVEDDIDVRRFAHSALTEFGYSVVIAENGQEALKLVEENNKHLDLLITDMIMPGMNGKELSEKIKLLKPDTEILYVSGYTEDHIVQSGELDKDINFLSKPYTITTLAKKVREVLDSNK